MAQIREQEVGRPGQFQAYSRGTSTEGWTRQKRLQPRHSLEREEGAGAEF
jgi:hypothetical protein